MGNGRRQMSPVPEGFRYASDTNTEWLTTDELLAMIGENEK